MSAATILPLEAVPSLAELVNRLAREREQPDPFVLRDLLTLLPDQCAGDGRLYRRQRAAQLAAEGYARAVQALRPGTRLHWQVLPDGPGWRWWGVLFAAGDATIAFP